LGGRRWLCGRLGPSSEILKAVLYVPKLFTELERLRFPGTIGGGLSIR
jgi:hypothetical protein